MDKAHSSIGPSVFTSICSYFALSTCNTARNGAPAGPGPVSYTHLDVYKRQVLGDPVLEGQGKADQTKGDLKQAGEKVKDAAKKIVK